MRLTLLFSLRQHDELNDLFLHLPLETLWPVACHFLSLNVSLFISEIRGMDCKKAF